MKPKRFLFVDFESYYDQDFSLRKLSPPEYILDPRFQVTLLAAYDVTWKAPRIVLPEHIPAFLEKYPAEETFCCSHNALFDLSILSWRYSWVAGQMADTLGMSRALLNLKKNSLGAVAKELFGADTKGDILHKVKGLDVPGIKRAGLWPLFQTYALNDVLLCARIYARLGKRFPVEERTVMDLVLRAAVQPTLHADSALLEKHLAELRRRKLRLLNECGYDKATLMSTEHFKRALTGLGVEIALKQNPKKDRWIPAFSKTDPFMAELLEYDGSPDDDINYQVQVLAAARLSEKSTIEETRAERFASIAKLPWRNGAGHSPLLPVALRYGGAHTHRLSGEWRLNMQNLPRDKVKSKLRSALLAPPGHRLITADLAQIEARIVACICGEKWLVDQFARGEDVYALFASAVFHRTVDKKNYPHERFLGKTAVLGLGYGCGVDRFYQMVLTQARQAGIPLEGLFDKEVAQAIVDTYRTMFRKIAGSWRTLDGFLTTYLFNPSKTQTRSWGPVKVMYGRILLPNGLFLRYREGEGNLYGAKLLENITQALARIVVMQAAVRLSKQGYRFVLQSHDELVFVVPEHDVGDAAKVIQREMTRRPEWLPELPLATEIGVGDNYGDAK